MKFYYVLTLVSVLIVPIISGCNDKGTIINPGESIEMIKVENIGENEILLEKQSIMRKNPAFLSYYFPKDKVIVEGLQKSIIKMKDGSTRMQYVPILVDCSNYSFLITARDVYNHQVDLISTSAIEQPYQYDDFVPVSTHDNFFKKTVKMICANYEPVD